MSQGKAEQRAARKARLEKALRENLRRRKAQARGRTDDDNAPGQEDAPEIGDAATSPERRS